LFFVEEWCTDIVWFRFINLVYTPEGEKLKDTLWEETMAELEFAGARGILEGMRK